MNTEKALFEEVLDRALDDALELIEKGELTEFEDGILFGLFSVLDWAKQQAEIWDVEFSDERLRKLDPYDLVNRRTK